MGNLTFGTGREGRDVEYGERLAEKDEHSLLDWTYRDFEDCSPAQKILLTDIAGGVLQDRIEKAFDEGAVWVLFCGPSAPLLTVREYGQIPSVKKVRELCESKDIPIFQFYSGAHIDDLVWDDKCSETVRNYPLIALRPATNDDAWTVHFDTGSPVSFFDIEIANVFLDDPIEDDELFADFPLNGGVIPVTRRTIKVYLADPSGQSPFVEFLGIIPAQWSDFKPRERACSKTCNREKDAARGKGLDSYGMFAASNGERHFCRYRWGLVGRNFLTETKRKFILDGANRVLHLYREEKT